MAKTERSAVQQELSALKRSMSQMAKEVPELNNSFTNLLGVCTEDAAVSCKIKELVALGAGVAVHCPPCILLHTKKCMELGLSRQEIIEAAYIGVTMGGGPAYTHMRYVFEALDDGEA